MNYYNLAQHIFGAGEYSCDDSVVWWLWANDFVSLKTFSIQEKHMRLLLTLVAIYLTYRLLCSLLYLLFSLCPHGRSRQSSTDELPTPIITTQSGMAQFFKGIFVVFFGLAIGVVAYYAHKQQQSSQLNEHLIGLYRALLNQVLYQSTGYELFRLNLSPNATLLVGTFLAACILYIMWGMMRFLVYHYIFGFALALFGLFLYYYRFPLINIASPQAHAYSEALFIIDREHQFARLAPSLIPKLLITLTLGYYLLLTLLKSFLRFLFLLLKISFRFLLYALIATILLNSVTTIISERIPSPTTI